MADPRETGEHPPDNFFDAETLIVITNERKSSKNITPTQKPTVAGTVSSDNEAIREGISDAI